MNSIQDTTFGDAPTMERFTALRGALRGSGGIALGDDLARLLDDHQLGDAVNLARLIAHRYVFGFEFRALFWIPMFQFNMRDLSLNYGASSAAAQLAEVFDGWSVAAWFAWPNPTLGDWRPVDVLDATPASVLSAARIARAAWH